MAVDLNQQLLGRSYNLQVITTGFVTLGLVAGVQMTKNLVNVCDGEVQLLGFDSFRFGGFWELSTI